LIKVQPDDEHYHVKTQHLHLLHGRVPGLSEGQLADLRVTLSAASAGLASGATKDGGSAGENLSAGTEVSRPDGTIEDGRIWLRGKSYRLTPGLRDLLSYLLANPGVSESAVMEHCGFNGASHLHKRLKDLRNRLQKDLKKSDWRLHIKA